jgi:tetratricopeptide (TPR) repeat protein
MESLSKETNANENSALSDTQKHFDSAQTNYKEVNKMHKWCDISKLLEKSINDCKEAIKIDPSLLDAYKLIKDIYLTLNDVDGATSFVLSVIEEVVLPPEVYIILIELANKLNLSYTNNQKCFNLLAPRICDICISSHPTFIPTYSERGKLYLQNKEYSKALFDFQEALRLSEKQGSIQDDNIKNLILETESEQLHHI